MEINKETENQIKELQILENNLQAILMQKQTFQLELSEIENALIELANTKEEVYRIAGNIMVKASKQEITKDLQEKKDMLSLRLKSLETNEKSLEKSSEELRNIVLSKIKNNS